MRPETTGSTPLLLVGAGGLGREALAAVRAAVVPAWAPIGFLDDNPAMLGRVVDGLPVLGPTDDVHAYPGAAVVLCVANPHRPGARRALAKRLGLPHERYGSVVHPSACLAAGTEVGRGSVLLAGVTVTAPQRLGAHVVAMPQVVITHDDDIGDFVTFAAGVRVSGYVTVGQAAYLGTGALVRESVRIGEGAVIGMGAVVLGDVGPGEVWAGSPARQLREREAAR